MCSNGLGLFAPTDDTWNDDTRTNTPRKNDKEQLWICLCTACFVCHPGGWMTRGLAAACSMSSGHTPRSSNQQHTQCASGSLCWSQVRQLVDALSKIKRAVKQQRSSFAYLKLCACAHSLVQMHAGQRAHSHMQACIRMQMGPCSAHVAPLEACDVVLMSYRQGAWCRHRRRRVSRAARHLRHLRAPHAACKHRGVPGRLQGHVQVCMDHHDTSCTCVGIELTLLA
jgi:hypothetical protein